MSKTPTLKQNLFGFGSIKTTINIKALSILFRQFATTLSSGVTLYSAISILEQQYQTGPQSRFLRDMRERIEAGGSLFEVFDQWKNRMPAVIPAMINIGEKTGRLEVAFESASELTEFIITIRNRIRSAVFYPIFLLILAFVVLPLPRLFSEGLDSYISQVAYSLGLLIIAFIAIKILSFLYSTRTPVGNIIHQFLMFLPVVGTILNKLAAARFIKVLAMGIHAGLDISESLYSAADVCGNKFISRNIYAKIPELLSGGTLTELIKSTKLFTPLTINLISVGEQAGNMDEMLEKAAQINTDDALIAIDRLTVLFGPVVFLAVAVYLGFQIVHFWQSYFQQIIGIQELLP